MNISGSKALTELPPIYFRAIDSYPDILDCVDLFGASDAAKSVIQQLLKNQAFEHSIQLSSPLLENVRNLFFEAYNQRRLRGDAILGIGYPILSFRQARQPMLAPLLIWPVQLEPHLKESGKWILRYQPSHQIRINPYLLHYWQTYFGWNQQDIVRDHKTYPSLLQKTINELLNKIAGEISPQEAELQPVQAQSSFSVHQLPDLAALDKSEASLSVHWSAVLGAFPPIFPHLPIHIAALKNEVLQWKDSLFGINIIPPRSATAWSLSCRHRSTCIQGSLEESLPFLAYALSNILSNGRTALIVSNRQSDLQAILKMLSRFRLEEFAFLFQNKREDWPLLRQLLLREPNRSKLKSYDNLSFENLQSQLTKMETELLKAYEASRETVFNGMNFRETLGYFFQHQKKQGKELLNSQLEESDYSFSQAEYEEICKAIEQSYPLYQQINTLHHPLEILHPAVLEKENAETALEKLSRDLETVKAQFTRLQHRYIAVANQYAERLHKYYHDVFRELSLRHQQLNEKLEAYNKKYGVDFQLTSLASLRLISHFSAKYKKILAAKMEVIEQFHQLDACYQKHAYFDFRFQTLSERRNIAKWTPELSEFQKALESWQDVLPAQIKKELLRLSPGRTKESLNMASDMLNLEQSLEKKIDELNAAHIFREPFNNVMLTLQKQQSYLESIVEKVEQTQVFLKDFPIYFQWKKRWTALNIPAREVIRALTKVKPEDWLTAFKSWFLYHRLSQAGNEDLPELSLPMKEFADLFRRYCQQLPQHIQALWTNRMERARKEWKADDKMAYQSFFSAAEESSESYFSWVDQILQNLSKVTQHLPIFLTSSSGAYQLGKTSSFKFDYVVLLDGASQKLQEAQASFHLSQKAIILDNPGHRKLTANHQPLTDYLNELPRFSLMPPEKANESGQLAYPIQNLSIIPSEGRYDEQEEVNVIEVQEVFQLLNEIEQSPQRTYPRVHIVCMTKAQRNLIYGYLLDVKQRNLPGKEKIQQLERNGLAVYYLDEIPIAEADYLIISNTYGQEEQQEGIREQLRRWQKKSFEQQMSILLNHSYQKIDIINSIPAKVLAQLQQDIIPYARILTQQSTTLENDPVSLPKTAYEEVFQENMSSKLYFVKEVGEQLKPYLDTHRLELKIDIIASKEIISIFRPNDLTIKVGILPDGFLGRSPSTHFAWENQQIERYQEKGIYLIPSYSVNWWQDPQKEIERLLEKITTILH